MPNRTRRPSAPAFWPRARRALSRSDPILGRLIRAYDGEVLEARGDAFGTLARSIVGQQISVKAAASVWGRLEAHLSKVDPGSLVACSAKDLRSCGLSGGKTAYLRGLARYFLDGSLDPKGWTKMEDEAVIADLTRVKGIGRWTAEMFLIFHLLRPDVLPLDDLGLRKAMARHYGGGREPSREKMTGIADKWKPWRSVATWYLWRSLDPGPIAY